MLLINILVIGIHVCPWELGGIIFAGCSLFVLTVLNASFGNDAS
jgi:hypothetical protein